MTISNNEIDFNKAIEEKNWQKAMCEINRMWVEVQVFLVGKENPHLKELNYINVTLKTGEGEYILAFMHTKGKKIQLHEEPLTPSTETERGKL